VTTDAVQTRNGRQVGSGTRRESIAFGTGLRRPDGPTRVMTRSPWDRGGSSLGVCSRTLRPTGERATTGNDRLYSSDESHACDYFVLEGRSSRSSCLRGGGRFSSFPGA
jgi:hypothetical protein